MQDDGAARAALRRERTRRGLREACGHARVHPAIDLCWECKPRDRVTVLVGKLKLEWWRPSFRLATHLVRPDAQMLARGCRQVVHEPPERFEWGLPSCAPCVQVVRRAVGVIPLKVADWWRYEDMQRVAFGAPSLADRLDEALTHQRVINDAAGIA